MKKKFNRMMLLVALLGSLFFSHRAAAQDQQHQVSGEQINAFIQLLKASGASEEEIRNAVNGIISNPDLYNTIWKYFIDQAVKTDSVQWKFLKDFNIQFKTFETTTDSLPASLGVSYDFNFDYSKFIEKDSKSSVRYSHSFGLSTKGNIAFKKSLNPNDFLETKVNYSFSRFSGGVIQNKDSQVFSRLNKIEDALVEIEDVHSEKARLLWEAFGKDLVLTNQYYYSISPKFGFESNQDFSKRQFTPGITADLGIKAWNNANALARMNIFDYPFAFIRNLTGADRGFTPYGSTLPTIQAGMDYVIPQNDTIRKALLGKLDPFPRFRAETSFRTILTRINKESIFFSANLRYYAEINAPKAIREAKLDQQTYFVMAVQSSKGFYVSYASGKLPFDAKNDEVYSLGFNYKF